MSTLSYSDSDSEDHVQAPNPRVDMSKYLSKPTSEAVLSPAATNQLSPGHTDTSADLTPVDNKRLTNMKVAPIQYDDVVVEEQEPEIHDNNETPDSAPVLPFFTASNSAPKQTRESLGAPEHAPAVLFDVDSVSSKISGSKIARAISLHEDR